MQKSSTVVKNNKEKEKNNDNKDQKSANKVSERINKGKKRKSKELANSIPIKNKKATDAPKNGSPPQINDQNNVEKGQIYPETHVSSRNQSNENESTNNSKSDSSTQINNKPVVHESDSINNVSIHKLE